VTVIVPTSPINAAIIEGSNLGRGDSGIVIPVHWIFSHSTLRLTRTE